MTRRQPPLTRATTRGHQRHRNNSSQSIPSVTSSSPDGSARLRTHDSDHLSSTATRGPQGRTTGGFAPPGGGVSARIVTNYAFSGYLNTAYMSLHFHRRANTHGGHLSLHRTTTRAPVAPWVHGRAKMCAGIAYRAICPIHNRRGAAAGLGCRQTLPRVHGGCDRSPAVRTQRVWNVTSVLTPSRHGRSTAVARPYPALARRLRP